MSEVKTIAKAALSRIYNPFKDGIVAATEAFVAADQAVTITRVDLGRIVGQAVSAMTTAGASADEAKDRIMETIFTVTARVEWDTVQDWVRAAVVADSLSDQDAATSLTTEALKTIGRVKPDERDEFVAHVVESGDTGVRTLRDLVKAHNEAQNGDKPSRATKGNAASAADAVKAATRIIGKNPLPDPDEDTEAFTLALMMLAVDVRTKCPKFTRTAMQNALEEVLHTVLHGDTDDASDDDA